MQLLGFSTQDIIAATDECVMCGLCLSHCPTYSAAKNEAESPRGRIAIVRAIHEDRLQPSQTLLNHLDQCLGCMNCAEACPVQIDYERILDSGRLIINARHTFLYRLKQSLLRATLSRVHVRMMAKFLLRMYRGMKADSLFMKLATRFPYALRLPLLIPGLHEPGFTRNPFASEMQNLRVALAPSCASDLFSDPCISSAELVLQALGCETVRLPQNLCCGALHQHSGDLRTAGRLIRNFCNAYGSQDFDAVASLATGCAAHISRYPALLNEPCTTWMSRHHVEICVLIARLQMQHKPKFRPLPETVFVHRPCTQKRVNNDPGLTEKLLSPIPGIRFEKFLDDAMCCGAGGMNVFTQAKLADQLIQGKIAELKSSQAGYLVTSNIGCALHFQAQLSRSKSAIKVCHPVQLLAQQLLYSGHA